MKIGSSTIFKKELLIIAYIVLLVSPSPLRIPFPILLKIIIVDAENKTFAYDTASSEVLVLLLIEKKIVFNNGRKIAVMIIPDVKASKIECSATLSAPIRSFAPILLETAELVPTPIPEAIAIIPRKKGKIIQLLIKLQVLILKSIFHQQDYILSVQAFQSSLEKKFLLLPFLDLQVKFEHFFYYFLYNFYCLIFFSLIISLFKLS